MIQKIGDTFIMNFSEECPAGTQNIFFAKSRDLLHWERTEHVCAPDGVYYMNRPEDMSNNIPRWDSLGIVDSDEKGGPPYYAFCTASGKRGGLVNKNGTLGLVTSDDGLNWRCLKNAFPDLDVFPHFEVPEHISFNGRHYVTFCTSSYLSFRFDSRARDMSGGRSMSFRTPFLARTGCPREIVCFRGTRDNISVSMVSVGRPLKQGGAGVLLSHMGNNGPDGWAGTVKLLEEAEPYRLRLRYNPVNDCLKHTLLAKQRMCCPASRW